MTAAAAPNQFSVRAENRDDFDAIRALLEASFPGPAEANLVDRLRSDGDLLLALLAVDRAGSIIGYAAFPKLILDDDDVAAGLAPLAVAASFRRRGVGAALVRAGIAALRDFGRPIVFVLGDPSYYRRFGFDAATAAPFDSHYAGPHSMALRLTANAPSGGQVHYPPAFANLE